MSVRLRPLRPADLPFADSLRTLAHWNQTLADWERFLDFSPQGCFLAQWQEAPAGVVTTLTYSTELAWIGMALVHPEYRRRGIGRALLERAIEHLQNLGVRTIKLDATPEGRPTYLKLGFKDETSLTRWQGEMSRSDEKSLEAWSFNGLDELDQTAFGADRSWLLQSLAGQSRFTMSDSGCGFGMLRSGARASYLGPVTAQSSEHGLRIVAALLAKAPGEPIFWDIFDQNISISEWARTHGFRPQRKLTRMYLGERGAPFRPEMQTAIGGPELG